MTYHVAEKRTLTCMGCGLVGQVTVARVMDLNRCLGEVFPTHSCGSAEWVALPILDEPEPQEKYLLMRPALIESGEIIETPYGDMDPETFREHARIVNAYWHRLSEEMRGFDL